MAALSLKAGDAPWRASARDGSKMSVTQSLEALLADASGALGLNGYFSASSLAVLAGVGVLFLMLVLVLAWKIRALKPERDKVKTCGYIAPKPSLATTLRVKRVFGYLISLQVGKVHIQGEENIAAVKGAKILSANHPHWADVGIMPLLVEGTGRFMAHGRVMTSFWGLLGVWLSKAGVFAANDEIRDGGARTREAATQMLVGGETVVIMPEGLTNFSPEVAEFKPGTVKIAREAARRLGKPVHIVPAYIRYGKYPGGWLATLDRAIQYFVVFLLFPLYRRQARVVVGKAVSTDDLVDAQGRPLSDEDASELLRQRVIALDPGKV